MRARSIAGSSCFARVWPPGERQERGCGCPSFWCLRPRLATKQAATRPRWVRLSRQSLSPRRRASAGVWPRSCASKRACCPQPSAQSDQVEILLARSLEIARSQQARCWELRAACDLASLWQSKGRAKEALQLLQPIYAQFTEGFDSADLRHAKLILDGLEPTVSQKQAKSRKPTREPHRSG